MAYETLLTQLEDGVMTVTLNRPDKLNAFTGDMIDAWQKSLAQAQADDSVNVVIVTGAGRAFCSGGDVGRMRDRGAPSPMDGKNSLWEGVHRVPKALETMDKPVIAMVNGFAIGGGHVLHVLCDLSIASDTAIFGQTGPRVGSVDAGHGTGFLARVVGEKKAREIWYMCRQYGAQEALAMGLVNKVVPHKDLRAEVEKWCAELLEKSPTALALAKQSFNVDSEQRAGVAQFAGTALNLYYQTEEAMEGRNAFVEKRPVNFGKFRT